MYIKYHKANSYILLLAIAFLLSVTHTHAHTKFKGVLVLSIYQMSSWCCKYQTLVRLTLALSHRECILSWPQHTNAFYCGIFVYLSVDRTEFRKQTQLNDLLLARRSEIIHNLRIYWSLGVRIVDKVDPLVIRRAWRYTIKHSIGHTPCIIIFPHKYYFKIYKYS